MDMELKELIAQINKRYGENTLGFAKDLKFTDIPRISSGSSFLDWALGKNIKDSMSGWPLGRTVELYGPESSGKSLISLLTIAQAQKKNLACAYMDCEGTFDKGFASILGVDTSKLLLTRESAGEKVLELAIEMLKSKSIGIIVFDSLAAMIPKIEIEDDLEDAQMASSARMMSKALRKLTHFNEKTLIIFINQLRENPGTTYGNPEYTPGGRALKFYASLRVDVRRGDWIFDTVRKEEKAGQIVKFRVTKNKTAPPFKEGYFKFLYQGELDKVDELISLGILNGRIVRRGGYFDLGAHTWQGRDAMEADLKKDEKLFEEAKGIVFS
jgi:recombination protein RecA